jgi:hypothetical protein
MIVRFAASKHVLPVETGGGLRVPTILPLFPSLVATDAAVADWDTATEEDCEGQTDPLANVTDRGVVMRQAPRAPLIAGYESLQRRTLESGGSESLGLEVVGRDGVVDPPKESDPNIGVVNLSVE